jgi:hypothetical protein
MEMSEYLKIIGAFSHLMRCTKLMLLDTDKIIADAHARYRVVGVLSGNAPPGNAPRFQATGINDANSGAGLVIACGPAWKAFVDRECAVTARCWPHSRCLFPLVTRL